jgi:hypothetical protein
MANYWFAQTKKSRVLSRLQKNGLMKFHVSGNLAGTECQNCDV